MGIRIRPVVFIGILVLGTFGLVWMWSRSDQASTESSSLYVTLSLAPDLNPTEQALETERFFSEMDRRVQETFHGNSGYRYGGELAVPLFARVFPHARLCVVAVVPRSTGDQPLTYKTLVLRGDTNYQMPDDFNQLMSDAGYDLNAQTLNDLAGALVIAALPTEMIIQPVDCDMGKAIDETRSLGSCSDCLQFVYELRCQAVQNDKEPVTVKLLRFDDRFRGGLMEWQSPSEPGVPYGYFFDTD